MTTLQPQQVTDLWPSGLTSRQLCLIAALVHREESLLQARGKESGRALLAEHVTALEQETDQDALLQSTQAALSRLEKAITLESYRVVFVAVKSTPASLERFKNKLKETFPSSQRYVCTVGKSDQKADPDVLCFHVYVPASEEPPNVALLLALVSDLEGVQYDNTSPCWLGEQTTALDDSWTLLP